MGQQHQDPPANTPREPKESGELSRRDKRIARLLRFQAAKLGTVPCGYRADVPPPARKGLFRHIDDGREILESFANVTYTRRVSNAEDLLRNPDAVHLADKVPVFMGTREHRTIVTGAYQRKLVQTRDK